MSVPNPARRIDFDGSTNASTLEFPVSFHFPLVTHIRATRIAGTGVQTILTLGVDYTLTGQNNKNGGVLTLVGPTLAVDEVLVVERIIPALQLADFNNQAEVQPRSMEAALDYITYYIQHVEQTLGLFDLSLVRVPKLTENETDGLASSAYDFRGNRGKNCADPLDPQDVATKAYVGRAVSGVVGGGGGGGSWISGTVILLGDLPAAGLSYEDQVWKIADPTKPRMYKVCMRQSDGSSFLWENLIVAST